MCQTLVFKVFLPYPLNIEKMLQEIWKDVFLECFDLVFCCFAWMTCLQHSEHPRNLCQKASVCDLSVKSLEITVLSGVNSCCGLSLLIITGKEQWGSLQVIQAISMWLS